MVCTEEIENVYKRKYTCTGKYKGYYLSRIKTMKKHIEYELQRKGLSYSIKPLNTLNEEKSVVVCVLVVQSKNLIEFFGEDGKKTPQYPLLDDLLEDCNLEGIENYTQVFNKDYLYTSKTYIDEQTKYYIEDQSGRLEIKFSRFIPEFRIKSTGVVVGFVGNKTYGNLFECDGIIFPYGESNVLEDEKKITIIQNPDFGSLEGFSKVKIVSDYSAMLQETKKEILLVGNMFSRENTGQSLRNFEIWFGYLKDTLVHVVPGFKDPTTNIYPQRPIHKYIFSDKFIKSLAQSTNSLAIHSYPEEMAICTNIKAIILSEKIISNLLCFQEKSPDNIVETLEEKIDAVVKQIIDMRYISPQIPDIIPAVDPLDPDYFFIGNIHFVIAVVPGYTLLTEYRNIQILYISSFREYGSSVIFDYNKKKIEIVSVN